MLVISAKAVVAKLPVAVCDTVDEAGVADNIVPTAGVAIVEGGVIAACIMGCGDIIIDPAAVIICTIGAPIICGLVITI